MARALDMDAYAPYGAVVACAPRGEAGSPANQGTARRFDFLAPLASSRPDARANLCAFRCAPWKERPIRVAMLERHACSTQVFVPMNATRYLVVVARGGDAPDLTTLEAFVAESAQGVTYEPGVWHHPMIALDAPTDFACLVWEDGSDDDCDVVQLADPIDVHLVGEA